MLLSIHVAWCNSAVDQVTQVRTSALQGDPNRLPAASAAAAASASGSAQPDCPAAARPLGSRGRRRAHSPAQAFWPACSPYVCRAAQASS